MERLREFFVGVPDVDVRLVRPVLFSSKTPIVVEVHGNDLDQLRVMSRRAQEVMSKLDSLADVDEMGMFDCIQSFQQFNRSLGLYQARLFWLKTRAGNNFLSHL